MKIKVVKCSEGEHYKDLIGQEFNIFDNDNALSYVISFEGKTRLILAKDCVNWDEYKKERC
jgi:hypothetical protein